LKEWEESNKNKLLMETSLNEKNKLSKKEDLIISVEDKISHFEKHTDDNVKYLLKIKVFTTSRRDNYDKFKRGNKENKRKSTEKR